jgi:hypothetical protein
MVGQGAALVSASHLISAVMDPDGFVSVYVWFGGEVVAGF